MTESEYWYSRSSRNANHSDLQHEATMNLLTEQQEYNLFTMLKPKLSKDGKLWCVLYGDNLQEGIAGFGNTPYLAILDFNSSFNKA